MHKKHPALHALKIAPKRFCRIYRECIRNKHPYDKGEYRRTNPGEARTIFLVKKEENHPCRNRYFNQDTEVERLTGYKGEKEGVRNNKRHDRNEEKRPKRHPSRHLPYRPLVMHDWDNYTMLFMTRRSAN